MQDRKPSEHRLVVIDIRLRRRSIPLSALLLLLVIVPFIGGTASPAAGQRGVVLVAGPTVAVESAVSVVTVARDHLAPAVPSGYADAALGGAALGGDSGQMLFPALTLGAATPAASLSMPSAYTLGPAFGLATGPLPDAAAVGSAGFIRPVDAPETSGFGPRLHPVLGRPMFHTGLDLGAVCGTPIRAAAAGTVVYAATTPSWGNRIIIAHSATLKTAYGHQSVMIAKTGDVVAQGQVIGLVGTTGWSTGCHLHFDVILNNHYVDPAPYLGLAGTYTAAIPFYAPAPGRSAVGPSTPKLASPNPPVIDGDVPIPAALKGSAAKPATPAKAGQATAAPTAAATTPAAPKPATSSASPTKPHTTEPVPVPTSSAPSPTSTTTTPSSTKPAPTSPPVSSTTKPSTTAPATTPPPTTSATTPPTTTSTTPPTSTSTAAGEPEDTTAAQVSCAESTSATTPEASTDVCDPPAGSSASTTTSLTAATSSALEAATRSAQK